MRRITAILLTVILVTLSFSSAFASSKDIMVSIDGDYLAFDVKPFVENGRTLVPFRAIFEKLGATVEWLPDTEEVVATKEGLTIKLKLRSVTAEVNGESHTLDVAPKAVQGRTFVPLRFVSEKFGLNVEWDDAKHEVVITTPKQAEIIPQPDNSGLLAVLDKMTNFMGRFEMAMTNSMAVNGELLETVAFNYEGKVNGPDAHMLGSIRVLDDDGEYTEEFEMIQVDGVIYIWFGDEWLDIPLDELLGFSATVSTPADFESVEVAVRNEFFRDQECIVYTVMLNSEMAGIVPFAEDFPGYIDFDEFFTEFYVDAQGNVLRQTVTAQVEEESFMGKFSIKVTLVVDYFDHGTPYDISPPSI